MSYAIGVDVGATKISSGLVWNGQIPKIIKIPTEVQQGNKTIISNIIKAIQVFDNPKAKAIGIGIAGAIDRKNGVVVSSPNLPKGFINIELKKIIEKEFHKPVTIENDAHCFALAESVYGAGAKANIVIGLTLGTGIGGGIIFNKRIYHGRDGLAGEIGHMTVVEDGLLCNCGQRGHLEVYGAGKGMVRLYEDLTGKTQNTFFIEAAAIKKDKMALRVIEVMSNVLGIGLANIINIFNPDIIVLGGGMARVKLLTKPAIKKARAGVIYPILAKTPIVTSKLGDASPVLGAALITREV